MKSFHFAWLFPIWIACGPAPADYADVPNLAAVELAFACGSEGESEKACAIIERFRHAGALRYPPSRTLFYLGEINYADGPSNPSFHRFALGGPLPAPAPDSRVDAVHRPRGAVTGGMRSFHDRYREAADGTVRALEAGSAVPGVDGDGIVPEDWESWLTPCSPLHRSAQSDGASYLPHGPGTLSRWWDDGVAIPPYEYLRQDGDRLYLVRPPRDGLGAAVAEVILVPGQRRSQSPHD